MPKRKAPADEETGPRNFAALKPRVHHVAEATVRKRWATLPDASQNKVKEIVRAGERPAIMIHRDGPRRLEAQQAVSAVQTTFSKRIPKIPFPPGTKEGHFDYESIIGSNRIAEAQLTSTTHYNQLLHVEIAKRKALLAAEKQELENLERNAKAEQALHKSQTRMLHPLLKAAKPRDQEDEDNSKIKTKPSMSFENDNDQALQRLTQLLLSHLESMQSNIGQMDQIKNALPQSKALLEGL